MIYILTKVSATIISCFKDSIQCKNQDYNVFVYYLTHYAWSSRLKRNKALLSNKFISFIWLFRDLIALRICNAPNIEIYKVTKFYTRLQVFQTDILLARGNSSVWKEETRVLRRCTSLWMLQYRYILTKVFPRTLGNPYDWIPADIEAINVSKLCVKFNASTCGLHLNTKLSRKEILIFTFQWCDVNV
jgi:hypothetical protein